MNNHNGIWARICAALVMAVAAAVVWGSAAVWCGYLFSQFFGSKEQVYEMVGVADDGTPVIQTNMMWPVQDQTFRTLDGKLYEGSRQQQWLTPANYRTVPESPGLIAQPVSWSQRIASLNDSRRQSTSWYLIRDAEPLGHAYFMGFDEISRLNVGYIGRQGFRRTLPPRDEWFDLGRNLLDWSGGAIASSSYIQVGGRAYYYETVADSSQRLPPWKPFLIDGDRLLEINLRARTVRMLLEAPGIRHVSVVTEPRAAQSEEAPANEPPAAETNAPDADADTVQTPRPLPTSRVAVQLDDRLLVLDPPTGAKREFTLPESLRERPIAAYVIGPDRLLIQSWPKEKMGYGPTELAWVKSDGSVDRQESIVLGSPQPDSERTASLMAAGVAPVPIGWLILIFTLVPLTMVNANQAATYGEALAKLFAMAWPAIVIVILVGVVLAWVTYHLQRKYRRPSTGVWVAFVLLLGVPGFIAYWLQQRRPKLESCKTCGEIVPRDRDACAACDAQFPAPALVGTEIFT